MVRELYELMTGRAWTTTRSCAAEFGPPPGAVYAEALATFTDEQLYASGEWILAQLQEQEAAVTRLVEFASAQRPEVAR